MTARKPSTPPVAKPRFQVVDDKFVAQLSDGNEVKLPLQVKTKLFRQISKATDDELGMVFMMLDGIGDQESSDKLDEVDIFETQEVVSAFFEAFTAKAQATTGESGRSSN